MPSPTSRPASPTCRLSSTASPTATTTNAHTGPCPHQATPPTAYNHLPKPLPAGSRRTDTHTRVRHDRIDHSGITTSRVAGRLHHIGIGGTHARTHITLLANDLHVRVINATTGELLREPTIDPTRDYQPQNTKKPPTP